MNPATSSHRSPVLTSWKDIANYLGKGVRTVQRWEQDFGLPVRRPSGSNKKAVLARPQDLDMWIALQCRTGAGRCNSQHPSFLNSSVRSALAAELEASRTLRDMNRSLREEIRIELLSLNATVTSLCGISLQGRPAEAPGNDHPGRQGSAGRRSRPPASVPGLPRQMFIKANALPQQG